MSITAMRNRPGTYLRGEETRRRILKAALEMFGELGYDAASTRQLAERAGVNLPAIQYYFGSKEGLHRAVVDSLIEYSETFLEPATSRARALLERTDSRREDLVDALCGILVRFVEMVSAGEDVDARRRMWARGEVEPSPALLALHEEGRRLVFDPCIALVARLFGRSVEEPEMILRTLALFGQATIFCHAGVQQMMGEAGLSGSRRAMVNALLTSQTKAILDATPAGANTVKIEGDDR
ncbi:MAG: CerR family C-terminal domain-containing protein [Pseudomonadota bacterium]